MATQVRLAAGFIVACGHSYEDNIQAQLLGCLQAKASSVVRSCLTFPRYRTISSVDSPASAQPDKWKILLLLLVLAVGGAVVTFRFFQTVADSFNPNYEYDTPLTAWVTAVAMNRQQYQYYLAGSATGWTNFNQYVAANPANRRGMSDTLGYDPSDLGHYLHKGDSLTKAAHSPILVVHRGRQVTRWILYSYTKEGKREAL